MNKCNNLFFFSLIIHLLIVYLLTKCDLFSFNISGEKRNTIYLEMTETWIDKGKNKSNDPDSLSYHTTYHIISYAFRNHRF